MKINYQKAKERITLIIFILLFYLIVIDPIIKWFYLPETNLLSPWYFAILLPIFTLIYYILLFFISYLIISGIMWIFGIEDTKDKR